MKYFCTLCGPLTEEQAQRHLWPEYDGTERTDPHPEDAYRVAIDTADACNEDEETKS